MLLAATGTSKEKREKMPGKTKDLPKSHREYKIRRRSDGLFSSGGRSVKWSVRGKTWRNSGALKNHLHQHIDQKTYGGTGWDQLEAIEMEYVVAEGGVHSVATWVTEMKLKKAEERVRSQRNTKLWRLQEAEAEVARLRAELGRK